MTLRERENQIFRKYRVLGNPIIRDGALSEEYETARRRLLVILKEPNDADGSFAASGGDIRDFGVPGKYNRIPTWKAIASWSAYVDNPSLSPAQVEAEVATPEGRVRHLRRIAVVNLKKTSGQSTSRYSVIEEYAAQHWKLLHEQFRLYEPHLTITGNIIAIVRDQLGVTLQGGEPECFRYFKDADFGVCIDFYHPNQRSYSNRAILKFLRRELRHHGLTAASK